MGNELEKYITKKVSVKTFQGKLVIQIITNQEVGFFFFNPKALEELKYEVDHNQI